MQFYELGLAWNHVLSGRGRFPHDKLYSFPPGRSRRSQRSEVDTLHAWDGSGWPNLARKAEIGWMELDEAITCDWKFDENWVHPQVVQRIQSSHTDGICDVKTSWEFRKLRNGSFCLAGVMGRHWALTIWSKWVPFSGVSPVVKKT